MTRYGKLHYQLTGHGTPLMLLHATPRSSQAYSNLVPLLGSSHTVIAPDTLGFGLSDPLPANTSIGMLAASLVDLLDTIGIERTAVFGLHTGNKIAAALAADSPERVTALLFCGMSHSIIIDRQRREAAIKAILKANPIDPHKVSNESEQLDRLRAQASTDAMYAANYDFDLGATMKRVSMPTLLLELATPQEAHLGQQAPDWAKHVPNCATTILERSDRDVLERFPGELAEVILGFLASEAARV
jgi:pimeloyl-ACP methyl ester carboxylesterase